MNKKIRNVWITAVMALTLMPAFALDDVPLNSNFTGTLVAYSKQGFGEVAFNVDYRNFFKSNKVYNPQLGVLSSICASDIYGDDKMTDDQYIIIDGYDREENAVGLLKLFGMSNTETINVAHSTFDTDDKTQFAIGRRLVDYNGEKREVIAVLIRGTNGTDEEWSSNFDIGASTADYYNVPGRGHHADIHTSDWKNRDNHKGFDVAANRVIARIEQYLANNAGSLDSDAPKVIWITGHSRGAAIANIVGAHYEDNPDFISFTYTFATPNTTTSANAASYQTIFNIVNSDDFVTFVPPAEWGFTKYGRTYSISVLDNYKHAGGGSYSEGTWEYLVGDTYSVYPGLMSLLTELAKIATHRDNLYKFTCPCHGDNSSDDISGKGVSGNPHNYSMSTAARDAKINGIPERVRKYGKITYFQDTVVFVPRYNFYFCQPPAYFMQLLASLLGGELPVFDPSGVTIGTSVILNDFVTITVAPRYTAAKTSLAIAGAFTALDSFISIGGIDKPHFPEGYYLLAVNKPGPIGVQIKTIVVNSASGNVTLTWDFTSDPVTLHVTNDLRKRWEPIFLSANSTGATLTPLDFQDKVLNPARLFFTATVD